MQRRTVGTASASVSPGDSSASSSPSQTQRRLGRKRPRPKDDWMMLDRTTLTVLASLGVTAFCAIHIYLFHNLLTARSVRVKQEPKQLSTTREQVSPLRVPLDYQQYTIRINTWKRLETLQVSLRHHASCQAVAQIQVVWCTAQGPPPAWLYDHPKVVVEEHNVNSLNERFHILTEPPTAGILSLDDDVLRPCISYDVGFVKWTQHPDRLVGYDARSHQVMDTVWQYAYKSTTERTNRYSLTLTRSCFVHVDYLRDYYTSPELTQIRQFVHDHLNCEDIALSFWVSSQTAGQAPLLADYWAVSSLIKLEEGHKISAGADHKKVRDDCVDLFAEYLHLKPGGKTNPLQTAVLRHSSYFDYGAPTLSVIKHQDTFYSDYLKDSLAQMDQWKADPDLLMQELQVLRAETMEVGYQAGLVQGTEPWKKRFGAHER